MKPRDTAGGIIVNDEGKIALVWQNENSWAFPKGGIQEGEGIMQAAYREVEEETGLVKADLELVEALPTYKRFSIDKAGTGEDTSIPASTRNLFLFKTAAQEMHPKDKEVTVAKFVTIDEALTMLTHPKDAEFLRSVRDKIER